MKQVQMRLIKKSGKCLLPGIIQVPAIIFTNKPFKSSLILLAAAFFLSLWDCNAK